MSLVVITEADILVLHDLDIFHHVHDVIYELVILVSSLGEGPCPGKSGLYVHVPEGADELVQWRLLTTYDSLPGLPDDIAHEAGDVDRVFISTLAEVLEEPFVELVVDELVVVADPRLCGSAGYGAGTCLNHLQALKHRSGILASFKNRKCGKHESQGKVSGLKVENDILAHRKCGLESGVKRHLQGVAYRPAPHPAAMRARLVSACNVRSHWDPPWPDQTGS